MAVSPMDSARYLQYKGAKELAREFVAARWAPGDKDYIKARYVGFTPKGRTLVLLYNELDQDVKYEVSISKDGTIAGYYYLVKGYACELPDECEQIILSTESMSEHDAQMTLF